MFVCIRLWDLLTRSVVFFFTYKVVLRILLISSVAVGTSYKAFLLWLLINKILFLSACVLAQKVVKGCMLSMKAISISMEVCYGY